MSECACGTDWIVEACDLETGRVRSIWHPVSMDWETNLNEIGRGSVTLATREVSIRDIWPGLTSVYISRISGGGASPTNPVCEFAGIVVEIGASESGTTTVGLQSIEWYLSRRNIRRTIRFDQTSQNEIGAALVAEAPGIPLTALADSTSRYRDREYRDFNRKNVYEAIEQLTQVINGPDYELAHDRADGSWSSQMIFRDQVGADRGVIIKSDREASAYSLSVSAQDMATLVDGIGYGQDEDTLIATARDDSGIYPRFDAAPAWKDIQRESTLMQQASGYLWENREPQAIPTVSLSGFVPDPSLVRLGDRIFTDISFGAATFRGFARIIGISWGLSADSALTRTLDLWPEGRASETVLNQVPDDLDCKDC